MVFAILSERYEGFVLNNEAAAYLKNMFPKEDIIYLMRNNNGDTGAINIARVADYIDHYRKITKIIDNADVIWLRLPSQWSFLFLLLFAFRIRRKKKVIHLCANRLTASFLLKKPSFLNLIRYFYGLLLSIYLRVFVKKCKFYYTGNHVKKNFFLRNGEYLVDQRLDSSLKKNGSGTVRYCYFGRLDKLGDQVLLDYLNAKGIVLDCYGNGTKLDTDLLRYRGFVASDIVASIMAGYSHYIHAGAEYYEGFPRTLFIAQSLGLECIVSRNSTFLEDITGPFSTYD